MKYILTTGKRKSAVARAALSHGNGIIRINGRLLQNYQPELHKLKIQEPLIIAGDTANKVDIQVNVNGGGVRSQTEAIRLAVGKALANHDKKLTTAFADYDRQLLVADVRRKEPRKPNCHGKARSKRQTSYR
ncbi:30S ribosomal protein S9 [Candidatus Woesearchaeota archaeon]|nr:30S ribosomal protein S9 [Candidatus Woesearchaeota archaeon]